MTNIERLAKLSPQALDKELASIYHSEIYPYYNMAEWYASEDTNIDHFIKCVRKGKLLPSEAEKQAFINGNGKENLNKFIYFNTKECYILGYKFGAGSTHITVICNRKIMTVPAQCVVFDKEL